MALLEGDLPHEHSSLSGVVSTSSVAERPRYIFSSSTSALSLRSSRCGACKHCLSCILLPAVSVEVYLTPLLTHVSCPTGLPSGAPGKRKKGFSSAVFFGSK